MEAGDVAKRLLHMVRVAYYMIRKGLSKRTKLLMDLHLLLKRGKMASKEAIGNLMITFHHHHHHTRDNGAGSAALSYLDPNVSYTLKEVEFSCSNTPSYPSFHLTNKGKGKGKGTHSRRHNNYYGYDATTIAKAFEILSHEDSDAESVLASPSPMAPAWSFEKSPAAAPFVRQLRVTDSPFPMKEEEEEADGSVDREAAQFIERFYHQLRLQQLQSATPTRRRPLSIAE